VVPELVLIATIFYGDPGYYRFTAPVNDAIVISATKGIPNVRQFDRIPAKTVTHLSPDQTLELFYPSSCTVEKITGGSVEVGAAPSSGKTTASNVVDGEVQRHFIDCNGDFRVSTYTNPARFTLPADASKDVSPITQAMVFSQSPLLLLHRQMSTVTVQNVHPMSLRDLRHPRPIAKGAPKEFSVHEGKVDLHAAGVTLKPGESYLVASGQFGIVVRISRLAQITPNSLATRLLDLRPLFEESAWQWIPPPNAGDSPAKGAKRQGSVIKRTDRNTFDR
jgi:hypothetical protein